jgi:hypothetical protein
MATQISLHDSLQFSPERGVLPCVKRIVAVEYDDYYTL